MEQPLHPVRACTESCLSAAEAGFLGQPHFLMLLCFRSGTGGLLKQTGVGETGHALSFAACANMGLASLMRDLQ